MLRTKSTKRIDKNRPIDQERETNKKIVERMNFIPLIFNIKNEGMRMKMEPRTYLPKKSEKKWEKQETKNIITSFK
jgi:hypothetical protein